MGIGLDNSCILCTLTCSLSLSRLQVFVGSPADGELHRGDVILAIENHDALHILHKQAMDLIKSAGGSLSFKVRR